jgi:hypothetical protein
LRASLEIVGMSFLGVPDWTDRVVPSDKRTKGLRAKIDRMCRTGLSFFM